MACGARSGLKLHLNNKISLPGFRRNGLWSPFGIETYIRIACRVDLKWSEWPVEPVRD